MYTYRVARIAKVIDGDTYDLDLDLGFYVELRVRVRLADIDTYEIYGKNAHPLGREAAEFAWEWMHAALGQGTLRVETFRLNDDTPVADGSFGRWIGRVYSADDGAEENLADALREAGLAEE